MKKVARGFLLLIIVGVLSGVVGYIVFSSKIAPVYYSTTQLYVVPGQMAENSLRTGTGSLNDDFALIFKSNLVIADAQRTVGTSEDLASYITINAIDKSNIVEITCQNPDQTTAKNYADAIAASALKTTSIIPVEKISILSEGTATNEIHKPNLYRNTLYTAMGGVGICLIIELLAGIVMCAFRVREEDDEADYNLYYGNQRILQQPLNKHRTKKQVGVDNGKSAEEVVIGVEKAATTMVNSAEVSNAKTTYENKAHDETIEDALLEEDILESIDDNDSDKYNDIDALDDIEESIDQNINENINENIEEAEENLIQPERNEYSIKKKEESSAEVLGKITRQKD